MRPSGRYHTTRGEMGRIDSYSDPMIYMAYISTPREATMPSTMVQVPILMSPGQKRRLAQKAKAANLTMAELLREGGERYVPADDPTLLDHMAKQVIRETKKTIRAIDKTLALVAESEARMLALAKTRKKG